MFVCTTLCIYLFFFFKQKTAYEMRISDWSSDVCSSDLEAGAPQRYRAPALDKGLDILELLASEPLPMTLTAIVNRLERSHGELFRMVQVLEYRGYIEQDRASDGYRLTDQLFSLGMQQPRIQNLVEIALPIMRQLTIAVEQSCHLAVHTRGP